MSGRLIPSATGYPAPTRFDDADFYHRAVQAHDQDLTITVRGSLSQEGKIRWLYDAGLRAVEETNESADDQPDLLS